MHGRVHPNYCQTTILLVVDPLSSWDYLMMTHPYSRSWQFAYKKILLITRQLPTNVHIRMLSYHSVPEPELSGVEDSVALLCEVSHFVPAVLLTGVHLRPVATAANFASFHHLGQHDNQCAVLLPDHLRSIRR